MTAEISILNKTAIVLAGDSAVTIGDGKKVYNTANKIFKLTNNGTVGIMIYNQANWMGIPLETIIKTYNRQIDEISYATIEEYKESFVTYIRNSITKYITAKSQEELITAKSHENMESFITLAAELLEEEIANGVLPKPISEAAELSEISKRMIRLLNGIVDDRKKSKRTLLEYKTYRFNDFKTKYSRTIRTIIDNFKKDNKIILPPTFTTKFIHLLYYEITYSINEYENYTGIVIAGFGDDEIFPKIIDFKLGEFFENKLRLENGKIGEIDNNKVAIIRPYAQRDMVDTFFQGIAPNLLSRLSYIIDFEFKKLIEDIAKKFSLKEKNLSPFFEKAHQSIGKKLYDFRNRKHVDPIVSTVSYLNKEGLIELAESLVNITSLKRKTSSDVETVGGPVDIALITKGDGFRWIKNKALN